MPAMANLSVKKADEVTNIVFDALTGAAGDGSEAVWRQDTGAAVGLPVGHRAILKMRTTSNGPRTARRAVLNFKFPYAIQNSTTTRYEATDFVVFEMTGTLPQAIPASVLAEAVHQFLNCASQALIKDSVKAGYSPQ